MVTTVGSVGVACVVGGAAVVVVVARVVTVWVEGEGEGEEVVVGEKWVVA